MNETGPNAAAPKDPPAIGLKLGSLTLTGVPAILATLLLLGLLAVLVAWSRPSLGMWLSGGMWLGFLAFWSATARRGGAVDTGESVSSRAVHQNLMNLGLLLLFVPVPGLRWQPLPGRPWLVPAGLGLQAAAALLHVWARRHLGRNWSSEVLVQTGHELVRSGPYRWVRHPIYTAILALAAGTAMVAGELHALLGLGVIAAAYVRKLRLEEQLLAQRFGSEWETYRRSSRALLPWLL